MSVFSEGQEVMRLPRTASASTSVHGPWQIAATGFCDSMKWRTNPTASGLVRRMSGFIAPPGRTRAS